MGERIRGFGSKKFGFYLPVGLEQGCRSKPWSAKD